LASRFRTHRNEVTGDFFVPARETEFNLERSWVQIRKIKPGRIVRLLPQIEMEFANREATSAGDMGSKIARRIQHFCRKELI